MKNKMILSIIGILIIILIAGGIYYYRQKPTVCYKNNCFAVELASTQEERGRGLMGRGSLDEDRGMLFIFENEGQHPFWMKNTLISLDIIWLDQNKKIVYIAQNAQPCGQDSCTSIKPESPAKYVLEINAGSCAKLGISVGDTLDLNL